MQSNTCVSAKSLTPPQKHAAEALLGRPLNDDEVIGVYAFHHSEPIHELTPGQWETEMDELIDSFPQAPILSDDAISRDSIYTREDEML